MVLANLLRSGDVLLAYGAGPQMTLPECVPGLGCGCSKLTYVSSSKVS
jgi:hypothetical protein